MFIAAVVGNVVTTQKVPKMMGRKLLLVDPLKLNEPGGPMGPTGRCLVAVDSLGAGTADLVLCTQGSSARLTEQTADAPVDCVVIGIIDSVSLQDKTIYRKDRP